MSWKSWLFGAALLGLTACGSSSQESHPVDGGTPISAPTATWTWIPIRGTTCGDGSIAGVAVNLQPSSPDLLVYMEGGGACWDANTCFTLGTAIQIAAPYTNATFQNDLTMLNASGLFSRSDPASPFAGASFVYVPYCTGDVHGGSTVQVYDLGNGQTRTVHHVGGLNAQVIADTVYATLPTLSRIWLVGSSAGGYGATLNLHRYVADWPDASVELLQDSAPFVDVMGGNYPVWQQDWGIMFPPDCANCTTSFPAVIDAVTSANPSSRIGLLTFTEDATVKLFFGYSDSLSPAIDALLTNQYNHPTTHAFVVPGTSHTMLGSYQTMTAADGTTLKSWVSQWATGDPNWNTVN
jgi:hypothetical protein